MLYIVEATRSWVQLLQYLRILFVPDFDNRKRKTAHLIINVKCDFFVVLFLLKCVEMWSRIKDLMVWFNKWWTALACLSLRVFKLGNLFAVSVHMLRCLCGRWSCTLRSVSPADLLVVVFQVAQLSPHVLHLLLELGLRQVGVVDHFVQRADLLLHRLPERLLVLIPAGQSWTLLSPPRSAGVSALSATTLQFNQKPPGVHKLFFMVLV